MKKDSPLPFVTVQDDTGHFLLSEEACTFLKSIEEPVAIIGVVGLYRTGKSAVLNQLLGRTSGFDVGGSVEPCTRGLWILEVPSETVSTLLFPNMKHSNTRVLLLDTEGLGSYLQTEMHDLHIFGLTLLLSSFFIFNSVGTIDDQAVDRLSLVVQLTRKIRDHSGEGKDGFVKYFPPFLWLVRDFSLSLKLNGEDISPNEYLERALCEIPGDPNRVSGRNEVRRYIKKYFINRNCFVLKRPVVDEEMLQSMEELSVDDLRPEYMEQIEKLKEHIFSRLEEKKIDGQVLSGSVFCELAKEYVSAMNSGVMPKIYTSWEHVKQLECTRGVEAAVEMYINEMGLKEKNEESVVFEWRDIIRKHVESENAARKLFRKRALVGDGAELLEYEEQLASRISVVLENVINVNGSLSERICRSAMQRAVDEVMENTRNGMFHSIDDLEGKWEQVIGVYNGEAKGPSKSSVLNEILSQSQINSARLVCSSIVEKMSNTSKEELKGVMEKAQMEYGRLDSMYMSLRDEHRAVVESSKVVLEAKEKLEIDVEEKSKELEELDVLTKEKEKEFLGKTEAYVEEKLSLQAEVEELKFELMNEKNAKSLLEDEKNELKRIVDEQKVENENLKAENEDIKQQIEKRKRCLFC